MVNLRLQLAPRSLEIFRKMVDALAVSLDGDSCSRHHPPQSIDAELHPIWQEELHLQLDDDLRVLRKLVASGDFGVGVVSLTETSAEAVLRACSALRLKVRETLLGAISDDVLESGSVGFEALNPVQQQSYATYAFLAGLQELLVEELDGGG